MPDSDPASLFMSNIHLGDGGSLAAMTKEKTSFLIVVFRRGELRFNVLQKI
jgi:hypothetical protein